MKSPQEGAAEERAKRGKSAARKRALHPFGKALARIRYFEVQRELPASDPRAHAAGNRTERTSVRKGKRARYLAAARAKAGLAPDFAHSARLPAWRELGPDLIPKGQTYGSGGNDKPPVSGRCVGIYVDPAQRRRLVLCSAGGGLWGSDDAGEHWRPLTDAQPTLSMGALAAAPSSPNVVYAATGEGDIRSVLGVGLLRSSDAGSTWAHVPCKALAGAGIYDLAVDPLDPLHVWIATEKGLFETRNGGRSARRVRSEACWSVSLQPTGAGEMLIAGARGLRASDDGGSTWSQPKLSGLPPLKELARMEVCHAPSRPGVAYVCAADGERAWLWRRATAAGPFRAQRTPARMDVSQAWYDWCFAVAPDDSELVFWGAIELYRGKRGAGGFRWSNISSRSSGDSIHPDQHHLAFDPGDPSTLFVCNDGGLFRSPDRGKSWSALNPGLRITEFEFLAQLDSDPAWMLAGTQDNGTLRRAEPIHWHQVAEGDGGDCAALDGAQAICFHSYYGMDVERARAKGSHAFRWSDASPGVGEDYPALFYPPMDATHALLAKAGCTVFVSEDHGRTWSEAWLPTSEDEDPDLASAVVIVSATRLFVGTVEGRLYRLTRASDGWEAARVEALSSPRDAFISDVVVLGAGERTIWTSSSAFGAGHVFRSSDGGATWSDRSGNLPDIPVNAIVVDPADPTTVFAATDHGVYRTTDSGARWIDFSNGLPNAVVGDLILLESARLLRAGTRSRGAWEVPLGRN